METAKIRQYAQVLREMDLTALEVHSDGSVRLERNLNIKPENSEAKTKVVTVSEDVVQAETSAEAEDSSIITSPMVGVFYAAAEENAEPLVQVGTEVKKGDVLCIIEAMKLMNEITAEDDGVIAEVFVVNGNVVEFGQPLFRLRKE